MIKPYWPRQSVTAREMIEIIGLDCPIVATGLASHRVGACTYEAALEGIVIRLSEFKKIALKSLTTAEMMRPIVIDLTQPKENHRDAR